MSIWSIEKALAYGYVMEPHQPTGDFSGERRMSRPGHECAIHRYSIRKPYDQIAPQCANQCDECKHICHMNDYIRGKAHCPPHFPVPAIQTDVEYVFGHGLADGIFIRVNGWIVAGAYSNGMLAVLPYTLD